MTLIVLGAILCGIAAVMLVIAERNYRAHVRWCTAAARAEGVVSRIGTRNWHSRNEPTSDDNAWSMPVVRFRAADGVEYEFDAREAPMQEGAPVAVAYDPALPSEARVAVHGRRFGCALIFLAVGAAVIAWGVAQALHILP